MNLFFKIVYKSLIFETILGIFSSQCCSNVCRNGWKFGTCCPTGCKVSGKKKLRNCWKSKKIEFCKTFRKKFGWSASNFIVWLELNSACLKFQPTSISSFRLNPPPSFDHLSYSSTVEISHKPSCIVRSRTRCRSRTLVISQNVLDTIYAISNERAAPLMACQNSV